MSAVTSTGDAAGRGPLRPQTVVVGAGRTQAGPGEPLNVPLVLASSFRPAQDEPAGHRRVTGYSREDATPTWAALETAVGELEGGAAVAFSSGMGAIAAVLDLLPAGSRIAAPSDSYAGSRALLADGARQGRWQVELADITDTEAMLAAAERADLLWLESPTNPLLDIADLPALCQRARRAGLVVAVDNTFATPLLQRPLGLGADVVVHSATKFIGGHSDLLLGIVVTAEADLAARLRVRRMLGGATPGGLEAFLALRGLRTMALRVYQGQVNAGELAGRLRAHPAVHRVRYPGLASDPGHERAAAQMDGFGAMISFEVRGGAPAADLFCQRLRVINVATSLGGVESNVEHRARKPGQEHLPPGLLRLSVGCEHVEDLWDDLDAALGALAALRVASGGNEVPPAGD